MCSLHSQHTSVWTSNIADAPHHRWLGATLLDSSELEHVIVALMNQFLILKEITFYIFFFSRRLFSRYGTNFSYTFPGICNGYSQKQGSTYDIDIIKASLNTVKPFVGSTETKMVSLVSNK